MKQYLQIFTNEVFQFPFCVIFDMDMKSLLLKLVFWTIATLIEKARFQNTLQVLIKTMAMVP